MKSEIMKLFGKLPLEKKKHIVSFKLLFMRNKSSAKEFLQRRWDGMQEEEKIQILFLIDKYNYNETEFLSVAAIFVLTMLFIIRETEKEFLPL